MKATFAAFVVSLSLSAQAERGDFLTQPLKAGQKNILTCQEMSWGDDSDTSLMSLAVVMDAKGLPVSMHASRLAASEDGSSPKFDVTIAASAFTKFARATVKNKIVGVDEDTKKPIYESGIEDVEILEGRSADGTQIQLRLNDHTYSGHPGSSFVINAKGLKVESGGPCDGPGAAQLDLGAEL